MQKTSLLCSFLLFTFLATPAVATESEQLFDQLDQNHDGRLVEDEIDHQHRRLFQRLLRTADSDRDGRLSNVEFQAGLKPQLPAKPLVKKQSSELPGANALLLLLAKMDGNSNGQIEEGEVPEQFRDIFQRIEDRLGGEPDGVLDRRELTQAAPRLSHIALRFAERMDLDVEVELALLSEKQWSSVQNMLSTQPRGEVLADPKRAREFFRQLDANGDGQISSAEVPDQIAERFEQLLERADRNNDGQISEPELMAVSRQLQARAAERLSPAELRAGINRLLKQLDRNGDRRISRQEAPRRMAGRFDRIDRDGNGSLDRDELAPVVELLSRLRPAEPQTLGESEPMMQPEQ